MNTQDYLWLAFYFLSAWVLFSISYALAVLTEDKKTAKEPKKIPVKCEDCTNAKVLNGKTYRLWYCRINKSNTTKTGLRRIKPSDPVCRLATTQIQDVI